MRAGKRRSSVALAASVVAALLFAGCSGPAEIDIDLPTQVDGAFAGDLQTQLEGAVTHAMGTIGASGAVVGVWAPWSGSWVAGVGTQTPGGEAVSADAAFRAAQTTRPMVCEVLTIVAAEGRIDVDDPVSQWVSGVADLTDVTLAQLCDGTSGIGSYRGQLSSIWMRNPERVWNPRELAAYGLGQPRTGEPGAAYSDSDAGYVLVGLALERATGLSASAMLRQYLFEPLGLDDTRLPSSTPAVPTGTGGTLTGLLTQPGEGGALDCAAPADVTERSASIAYTDGGVTTDVADLGRYVQSLAAGTLVPESATEERTADAVPLWAGAPSWLTTADGMVFAGSLVGNFGSVPGYSVAAFADPTTGLTVVVALNNSVRGGSPALYLAWELAAIASKATAAEGQSAPEAGLPWTAEQFHASLATDAVCTPAG